MDFPEAIEVVIQGGKITREAWKNKDIYGFLNGDKLSIHKPDDGVSNKYINFQWVVNDGDLMATDWIKV